MSADVKTKNCHAFALHDSCSSTTPLLGSYRKYWKIGGWGVSPTGKSFRVVPCVRACALAGCLVELDLKSRCHHVHFSLLGRQTFPFPFLGRRVFSFSLPPTPQTFYPTLVGLIGTHCHGWASSCRFGSGRPLSSVWFWMESLGWVRWLCTTVTWC